LVRARSGGALDAALRPGHDEHDLGELHRKLDHLITSCVPEDHLPTALEMLNEAFGGRRYGEHEVEDEEQEEHPARERMRGFLQNKGATDEDVEELFAMLDEMPRNAREGGMGGRLSEYDREARDRKRGARDRRRPAMDSASAASSFEKMFGTHAARIKQAF
jgi:hypothetical protein